MNPVEPAGAEWLGLEPEWLATLQESGLQNGGRVETIGVPLIRLLLNLGGPKRPTDCAEEAQ